MDRWLIVEDDGAVREALDLDTALHTITADPKYAPTAGALLTL
jgi:hypothetical protein